jgi:hypothetical protein
MWFGLLFFAGITSSLAMGTPWMGFMRDEFGWNRNKGAWSFGLIALLLGLPTVFFYQEGVFDDYDYWAGTVSLVAFAFFEVILFSWIFGINKGWDELMRGADIKIPIVFKYVMKYVTPLLLGWVFIASLPDIYDNIVHKNTYNRSSFADVFYAEKFGDGNQEGDVQFVDESKIEFTFSNTRLRFDKKQNKEVKESFVDKAVYTFEENQKPTVKVGDKIKPGSAIAEGKFINKVFYKNIGRIFLVSLFLMICVLVYTAYKKRVKEGRATL